MTAFAELVAATNFSFLRGASHAHEMVGRAAELGLAAIGIADRNTLAGVVRAHTAAKEHSIRLPGRRAARHRRDGFEAVCYPDGPRRLRPAVPPAHGRQPPRRQGPVPLHLRGDGRRERGPDLHRPAAAAAHAGFRRAPAHARRCRARPHLSRRASSPIDGDERRRLGELASSPSQIARAARRHQRRALSPPRPQPLADVLTCIRENARSSTPASACEANAERHLKPRRRDGAPVRATIPRPSPARSRSPSASTSPSTSCATNIPTSRCRRARPRKPIWRS